MTQTSRFDYDLPKELIAQEPLAHRSDARLMVVHRASGAIEHSHVRNLAEWLTAGDCLVFNNTRVVPARLVGVRAKTGGRWQGLFLRADEHDIWHMLCKTRGKVAPGEAIVVIDRDGREAIRLRMVGQESDGSWRVVPEEDGSALELLERAGRIPLPPYIRGGEMTDGDTSAYQTVYAARPGAVAAPTAGLHFTPELLERLSSAGMARADVTLHVGVGTFKPIESDSIEDHVMHYEWGEIQAPAVARILAARAAQQRVVAVGTTSVRVLETAAAASGRLEPWEGETNLFIKPPYSFRAVDALMTNFHLPRSTLLVLVSAFAGLELIHEAYREAIRERYRFYSYGDAMLIL